ncbi:hypothetical protein H5410_021576 [Solanum commersonii]|uniref:Uncharacterized protein n=1 Tax=Solanum commersonii TaxID=4109 RepID=A0A9J5ZED0_SOLCO|nr:hypothetical protein H5410_021576 [Solanum commersonii]
MTPTLEEIASFMGKESNIQGANLRNKRPIIPKNVDTNMFMDLLKINQIDGWVSLDFLYERFTPNWCNYVSSHKEREAKIDIPKGILACEEKLSVWLNNCHENMGRARRQVHRLAEQISDVIKNHRFMNDTKVPKQARAIVSHLPKVLISDPFFPPGYGPFDNCGAGLSTTHLQGMPFRNNPTVTTAAPVYTLPQPTVTHREA